ncbi:MAG: RnfABCDGE type electron transport complex subunit D [Muribaculaceae bacterium]|nr:RnfABCDGE type electron transport complex subunit D [Muribaculaceae bacterium]
MKPILTISASPHIHTPRAVSWYMWQVVIALIPAVVCSLYYFGVGAAIVIATSIVGCVVTEYLINRYMLGREGTIANGSAILTGLLLALNLPSNLPIWAILIGSIAAIGIGKMAFGGLGCNIFNPALVGRVFLLISFPVLMTSWPIPLENSLNYTDATTGATILGQLKMDLITPDQVDTASLLMGNTGGSLGEVGSIALIIGFVYLVARRVITWHIPLAVVGAAALMSLIVGGNVVVEILSGGLLLGAIFMATDYVTSPMTHAGMIIYGCMIGIITIIIRHFGVYPEGMSFAILIMNGFVPLINRYVRPHQFGERRAV